MIDNKNLRTDLVTAVTADLHPTTERIMGPISYGASFLGGCASIGTFSMGAGLAGALTIRQMILAMMIGCMVLAVAMVLTGSCGHKYGIPYSVQLRSSFGISGMKIPGFLRAIPAIVWFGYLSWIGAEAVNAALNILFGINSLPVVFVLFTILQVALAIRGIGGIQKLENTSCIFVVIILIYMLYIVNARYSAEINMNFSGISENWGMPFWAATTSFLGIYTTMILNASDYAKNVKYSVGSVKTGSVYFLSITPITILMGLLGLLVAAATGNCDLIAVLSSMINSKFLTVILLLFVAFSQLTTNILCNIVPPSYVLIDTFNLPWKYCTILVGALSIACCPWLLVSAKSSAGLSLFTQAYSAFLGPIFTVIAVDYYILRKQKLDVNDLYDSQGIFRGVNWVAIIAVAFGSLCSLRMVELSWYISLLPTGILYYVLMKYVPAAKSYCNGTIFEK